MEYPIPFPQYNKILIVEDDPSFQIIVAEYFLRKCKFRVHVDMVESVPNALFKLGVDGGGYGLVIIDHNLQGKLNGLMLHNEIAKHHSHIQTVMMSGMAVEDFIALTKRRKFAPLFLSKPFKTHDLDEIIFGIAKSKSKAA